jgi:hypothetical protein
MSLDHAGERSGLLVLDKHQVADVSEKQTVEATD